MHDRCYATLDAPCACASNARRGPLNPRWPVVFGAMLVASCQPAGLLDPQGPIASAQLLLLINSTAIMLVVVVPVILATLWFAWWYRASNPHATRASDEGFEGRVEFVVWSIPVLIVILLGGVIWISSHQLDPRAPIPAKADPLRVEVVALDWKWLFIYPDQGVAAVNQLVIPVGTPVNFRLTSATVMNSFFVPQLGSQIYTMGGMTTHLNLLADHPGEYPGFSAMFSGDGFSEMRFVAKAVPPGDFDAWVPQVRGSGFCARRGRLCRIGKAEQGRAADDLSLGRAEAVRPHHRADAIGSQEDRRRRSLVSARITGWRLRCWAD